MGQTATRYEGSRRWYRGQIMQALCALPPATALEVDALGARVKPDFAPADRPLLLDLVAALGRDGLLTVDERPDGTMWLALPDCPCQQSCWHGFCIIWHVLPSRGTRSDYMRVARHE